MQFQSRIGEIGDKIFSWGQISPEACNQIHSLNKEYWKAFNELTELLDKNKNDSSLKFLMFRLDFNDYYKNDWDRTKGGIDFS